MIKKVMEERIVKVEKDISCCDICDIEFKESDTFVTVRPSMATSVGHRFQIDDSLDVCTECLTAEGSAIKLVMDSKMFPRIRTACTARKEIKFGAERCSLDLLHGLGPGGSSYSSATCDGGIYTPAYTTHV